MNESRLDLLLRDARVEVPTHLAESAAQTSRAVAAQAGHRRRRRRWAIPVAVALGAVAVTAAAPYVMPGLDRWPYVSIVGTDRRAEATVPVTYVGTGGDDASSCGAWIDVANASDEDMERLTAAIESYDWPVLTYGENASDDEIFVALEGFIKSEVPGIGWGFDDPGDTTSVHVSATGVLCEPTAANPK